MLQVALPVETSTGTCFLQHYIESILALEEASCRATQGLHPKGYFILLHLYMVVTIGGTRIQKF